MVIERNLTEEQAIEREQYYLDNEKNLYNVNKNASRGGDLISYHPNREEVIANITRAVNNRYANMSKQEKLRLSERLKGERNPNYGNRGSKNPLYKVEKSDIHRKRISKALTGRTFSKKHKENISIGKTGKPSWNKGLKTGALSEKHRENISKSLKGRVGYNMNSVVCENILFESIKQASDYYQVSSTAIIQRLKSKSSKWKDFCYYDEVIHNIESLTVYNENMIKSKLSGNTTARKVSCEGIMFNSIKEAQEHFGVKSPSTIVNRVKSELYRWKDYYYID
jgi:hypothetical protein